MRSQQVVWLFVLGTLGGCWLVQQEQKQQRLWTMGNHYSYASDARDAVVTGNLNQLHQAGADLGLVEAPSGLLAAAQPHVDRLRTSAIQLERARDTREGAAQLASMASACGGCHRVHGIQIEDSSGLDEIQSDHGKAALRMWDGLIWSSEEIFTTGATDWEDAAKSELGDKLKQLPGPPTDNLAKLASESPDWWDRSALYGQLLRTCASCHQAKAANP